ncbi:NAD/NADP-dependent octopine/nopaline dehydrogenase family protein [Agrobacterium fabrum]|uniref:NAD/NADP-dependent octopine/nopaline dehydrogenase family protein n=1 Tax=Agrobacterium fabrum TaxID=1176649 RepID=UPI0015734A34|nr:NAD/NADP-dependent octopine/nopaline dehydrogenase family protein [Agrobacterium fabrum]WCK80079.1 NAD/NADP octopine/nopaline dehydrogenase family protein [Agrobacterium fabrum]
MKIAIIGAGGSALGYAALLHAAGHTPTIWSPSGRSTTGFNEQPDLIVTGKLDIRFRLNIADTCASAVSGADAVVIAVPGFGKKPLFDTLASAMAPGQPLIISAHGPMDCIYFAKAAAGHAKTFPVVVLSTTVATSKREGATGVLVSALRSKVDMSTLPASWLKRGLELCETLFGERFYAKEDALVIALSNLNPELHAGNVLCNLTRLENGEDWAIYGMISRSAGRMIDDLDKERLATAAAFGFEVRDVRDHFSLSFGVEPAAVDVMAKEVDRMRGSPRGPKTADTRFVLEDVPFGLVPLATIGRIAGAPMPLHEASTLLFSSLYGMDFNAEFDFFGPDDFLSLDKDQLHEIYRSGW